jgi:hypothetical protein
MPYGYEYLKTNPDALGWWTYLFVHTKDKMLIGSGGYKGKADDAGVVEIGYGIAPAYRIAAWRPKQRKAWLITLSHSRTSRR